MKEADFAFFGVEEGAHRLEAGTEPLELVDDVGKNVAERVPLVTHFLQIVTEAETFNALFEHAPLQGMEQFGLVFRYVGAFVSSDVFSVPAAVPVQKSSLAAASLLCATAQANPPCGLKAGKPEDTPKRQKYINRSRVFKESDIQKTKLLIN